MITEQAQDSDEDSDKYLPDFEADAKFEVVKVYSAVDGLKKAKSEHPPTLPPKNLAIEPASTNQHVQPE